MSENFELLLLTAFACTALTLVALERVRAWQRVPSRAGARVAGNISLFVFANVVVGVLIPVGIYAFARRQPPGLVSASGLGDAAQWLLTFLLLDLWRYAEHRLFHRLAWLWRLHLVHHSDTEVDVTTTERHHPVELVLGTLALMALIGALGLPATGVAIYLLTATLVALCSHANLRLAERWDTALRWLLVTPPVHLVHHSERRSQTDSNYGSVLTVWDRLFGTYRNPALDPVGRVGLSYFRSPADARLSRLLQQPWLYRRTAPHEAPPRSPGGAAAASDASQGAAAAGMPTAWRRAIGLGAAGIAAASLALWPTWVDMAGAWQRNEAYRWGWLVLPLIVYLLGWHHRSASLAVTPRPDFTGLLPTLLAITLWWVSQLMDINVGRQLALVLAMHGITMSALGWQAYRRFFPILALMFLMVPSADLLQPLLRTITLRGIELFAQLANLPHRVDGFAVLIGERRYVVVDACSGLTSVSLAMFLGYAFGLLLYRSPWKIAALALFGAAVGVLSNLMRVNAIVLIDRWRGSQMDLAAHREIQWIALLAVLAVLLFVLSRLRGDAPAAFAEPQRALHGRAALASRTRWSAPVLAGVAVLLLVGAVDSLLARTGAAAQGAAALPRQALVPQAIAGWTRVAGPAGWSADPGGLSASLNLSYRLDGQQLQVTVVEALAPHAKLPAWQPPQEPGTQWFDVRKRTHKVCVAGDCASFVHATLQREMSRQRREVYWAYGIGQSITTSTLALRATHAWNRVSGRDIARRSFAFASGGGELAAEDVARAMRELHAALDAAAPPP